MTICAMCFSSYESQTSYGLCPDCWTKDRLREWDRLQSATKEARRQHVPALLELRQWLVVLAEWDGRCAYCQVSWYQHIEMVDANKGLVQGNVVPVCYGCREHKRNGWQNAERRVQSYLAGELARGENYEPLFLPEPEEVIEI